MPHVITFINVAGYVGEWPGPGPAPVSGQWLKSHDPDAREGRGDATWTSDPAEAMKFEDGAAAFNAWRTQSTVCPYRDDGKPNRPLTAYSITVDRL